MSVLDNAPQVCAWCLEKGTLTILNDATWEQALDALEERALSHGMCQPHADATRATYGLRAR